MISVGFEEIVRFVELMAVLYGMTLHSFRSLGIHKISLKSISLLSVFEVTGQLTLMIIIFRIVLKAVSSLPRIPLSKDLLLIISTICVNRSLHIIRTIFGLSFLLIFVNINVYSLVLTRISRILSNSSHAIYTPMSIFGVRRVLLARNLP